ncbi:Plasmodium exported protein, unknown function [Plasmodium reichenowi]|uniref:Uncharacterized protein n=1 Tax=Plasmodium reichenowi TaxID=5854 RepID=A0A060S0B0_PLARE|nr:Plasmodium exported protein, unknown function [Plasmodium reichenowi]
MELFVLVRIVIFVTFFYILLNILHDNLFMIKLVNSYSYSYLWNIVKLKNRKILSELSDVQLEDNDIEDFIVSNNVLYSNDFLNIIDPIFLGNYDNINLDEYIKNFDNTKEESSSARNFSIAKCNLYNNHGEKKLGNIIEVSHDNVSNEFPRMISEESADEIFDQLFDEHSTKASNTLSSDMMGEVNDKFFEDIIVEVNEKISEESYDETLENMPIQFCNIMKSRGLEEKLDTDKEKHIKGNLKRYYSSRIVQDTDKRENEKCISSANMKYVIKLTLEKNKAQEEDVSVSSEVGKMTTRYVEEDTRDVIKVVKEKPGNEHSKYEEGKCNMNLIKELEDQILQKIHKDEISRKESKMGIESNTIDIYKKGRDCAKGRVHLNSHISKMSIKNNSEKSKEKKIKDTKRKKLEQKMLFEANKKNEERKRYGRINDLGENVNNDYFYFSNDYSYLKRKNTLYNVNTHNYTTRLKTKEQRISEEKQKYNIIRPSDCNTLHLNTRKKERPNIIFKEKDKYGNTPISFVQMNNSMIPLVCSHYSKEILHTENNGRNHFETVSFDNLYNDIRKEENYESIDKSIFLLNEEIKDEMNDERNNGRNHFETISFDKLYNYIRKGENDESIGESSFVSDDERNNETNHFEMTSFDNIYDIGNEGNFEAMGESIFDLNDEVNNETNNFETSFFDDIYNDIRNEEIIEPVDESIFHLNDEINDERNNEENNDENNDVNNEENNEVNNEEINEENNEVNNEENNKGNGEINNEGNNEENNEENNETKKEENNKGNYEINNEGNNETNKEENNEGNDEENNETNKEENNKGNDEINNEENNEGNNEINKEENNKVNDEINKEENNEGNNEENNEINNEENNEIYNEENNEEYDYYDSDDDYEESLSSSDEWFNDESSEEESDEEMHDYKVSSSELTNLLNRK